MAFNDGNVLNRSRHLVRGRVIVNTTSSIVEYLEESLRDSIVLYNFQPIQPGRVACFMVEVNGYLTFDKDSFVKISPELSPFRQFEYNPIAWNYYYRADPYPPVIGSSTVVTEFNAPLVGSNKGVRRLNVSVNVAFSWSRNYIMEYFKYVTPTELSALGQSTFVNNALFKGPGLYPGFSQIFQ